MRCKAAVKLLDARRENARRHDEFRMCGVHFLSLFQWDLLVATMEKETY